MPPDRSRWNSHSLNKQTHSLKKHKLESSARKAISNSLLAKGVVQHSQRQMTASSSPRTKSIHQVALDIRGSIRYSKNNMPCTPRQSEQFQSICPQTVQRLLNSFVQDLVFGVIRGCIKTPRTYCHHTPSHPSPIIPISFRLLIGVGMVCLTHHWKNWIPQCAFRSWLRHQRTWSHSHRTSSCTLVLL